MVLQKYYPAEKLYELARLTFKVQLPLAFIYAYGWFCSEWDDYRILFACIVANLTIGAAAVVISLLVSLFEKQRDKRNYLKLTVLALSLLWSSLTQATS